MSSCLGIQWLGDCQYNPAAPASIYFSLGEAVGALAFTLAVQQLLRPIYRFRLAARRLKLSRLYVLVFAGVAAALVAALLPSLPIAREGPWGYPVVWEVVGALFFVAAYGAVVVAMVTPVKVRRNGIPQFANGIATLLSAADETDHVDLSADVFQSLPTLIRAASFLDFRRETSAFFDFAYRREIEQAQYAISLLHILADPRFCETLVKRAPWHLAAVIRQIGAEQLHTDSAEGFIREVAHQAIIRDDSIVAQETGYRGFGSAPLLSESLFSEWFIVSRYNPLDSFYRLLGNNITGNLLDRFNGAAKRCYLALIEHGDIDRAQVAFSIQSFYRSVFSRASKFQQDPSDSHIDVILEMTQAVTLATGLAVRLLASVDSRRYDNLFVEDATQHRHDVLETLVEIVYEAVAGVANKFKGFDDPFWTMGMDMMHHIFNSIGTQPDGLTPFQQRLALKFSHRLDQNIKGYYPAVTRVLLATVGPYRHAVEQPNRTAFNILKDVLYIHLKRFHRLASTKPKVVSHYLPPNVNYTGNSLKHKYRSGAPRTTDLTALVIPAFALTSKRIQRAMTVAEVEEAKSPHFI
ncbi:hypothetical protein [Bradyrhizobium diazoefficiens]|uniref:hypothetical protein n=1 Tax=Bradyrhizobium diazoefficiens TaxID=1355477 RepID=UPI00272CB873|nr:hypothetical protein [Bradyrhizobium diazoefficiens]WLA58518.1 hypothetical protein QIH81_07615 [Bradyrhizobium diazoefficiens]